MPRALRAKKLSAGAETTSLAAASAVSVLNVNSCSICSSFRFGCGAKYLRLKLATEASTGDQCNFADQVCRY
ncbi:hypothetical protein CAter10_2960 [Collimonas arenae]|nr:hypothetical protein CAter10_2960 [Collimonas arenae]